MIRRGHGESVCFGVLIGTPDSHLSLLPVIREMAHLVEGTLLNMFLGNAGFGLTTRIWGNGVAFGCDRHH